MMHYSKHYQLVGLAHKHLCVWGSISIPKITVKLKKILHVQEQVRKICKPGASEERVELSGTIAEVAGVCLQNLCLKDIQKIRGGEEKLPSLEQMASSHSLSKSNVTCAIMHEQVQYFSNMSWRDFFPGYFLQFALHLAICYHIFWEN